MATQRKLVDQLMCQSGWLAAQPQPFQLAVLKCAKLMSFEPGEIVYRMGDPLGGIYGLVSGVVTIDTAPPGEPQRLVQVGMPGSWTGEGCFLSRQPRRLTLQARTHTWMLHLPLAAMDEIALAEPNATRCFSQILMATVDVLMQIVHDLQIPNAARRIASTLSRIASVSPQGIPLSQAEIGVMANASRVQVNSVLGRFTERGWISSAYRTITILDARALTAYARAGDERWS